MIARLLKLLKNERNVKSQSSAKDQDEEDPVEEGGRLIRLTQDQDTQTWPGCVCGHGDSLVHSEHFRQLPKNKEAN